MSLVCFSSLLSVPAACVDSIFRPFVSPKTAICVFRVIGTGSRACFFSLSRGFNQRCVPEPRTDVPTHRHTRPQETAGCVCGVRGHLERAERVRERRPPLRLCSACHASAPPHNRSLCSALPRLPRSVSLQTPITVWEGKMLPVS